MAVQSQAPDELSDLAASLLEEAAGVYLSLLSLEEAEARGDEVPPQAHRVLVVRMARRLATEIALLARLSERQGQELEPLQFLVTIEHSLLLLLEHEAEISDLPLVSASEFEERLRALDGRRANQARSSSA